MTRPARQHSTITRCTSRAPLSPNFDAVAQLDHWCAIAARPHSGTPAPLLRLIQASMSLWKSWSQSRHHCKWRAACPEHNDGFEGRTATLAPGLASWAGSRSQPALTHACIARQAQSTLDPGLVEGSFLRLAARCCSSCRTVPKLTGSRPCRLSCRVCTEDAGF